MQRYTYNGPVLKFNSDIGNFRGETYADNEKKARSNLAFQCKKKLGLVPGANIKLPGKVHAE